MLDFSKAFDTVKHEKLMYKLSLLDLPDEVGYITGFETS